MATGTGNERRAGFGQLQHCGSTWVCPVCSHKIAAHRAEELARVVAAWHRPVFGPQFKKGPRPAGRIIFLTLTMKHKRHQRLADLWANGISAGWHAVTSGRAWKTDQENYGSLVGRKIKTGERAGQTVTERRIGFARVVETTHGENGWHVHVHALLFVHGDITSDQALALGDRIYGRWASTLQDAGFGTPSIQHGVDVRLIGPSDHNKVSDYFTKGVFGASNSGKVSWEAAGGTGKNGSKKFGNRTPFQILGSIIDAGNPIDTETGEVSRDLELWWEWEEASKGKRQLTWSPWLRESLQLEDEKTDEEIAAETLAGETVLELRKAQWRAVESKADQLLDAVEADDDLTAAFAWLQEHCRSASGDPLFSPGEFAKPLVFAAA